MDGTLVTIIALLLLVVALLGYGGYLLATRRKTILAERLETYAGVEEEAARATDAEMQQMRGVPRVMNMVLPRGYMSRLEEELARADIPMRPTEYVLLRLVLAGVGFLLGRYFLGYVHSGIILAVAGFIAPAVFVRVHQNRRRTKFVKQLADALMLLTNSLRSGYGFLKGLELVAKEMSDPIAKELNRMLREVNLGATVDEALLNLGRRVNSQDLDIVIGAYLVQKDVGGNLTEIMEKVAETIRERLRIQGDIRVLTTQGKLSGVIVGLLPFGVFMFLILAAPTYFSTMLGPPIVGHFGKHDISMGVVMLICAVCLQLIGAYVIRKIISIKV
ncbi:MAG TPA: type II secretion system F family protein [Verrucomicrobiae bacterium]|nr:type II secretion system F family protein [Verrucomicrobiae bacterium]